MKITTARVLLPALHAGSTQYAANHRTFKIEVRVQAISDGRWHLIGPLPNVESSEGGRTLNQTQL